MTKFSWSVQQKVLEGKYKGKWVEGPAGKLWISSVYPIGGNNGFACLAYVGENYEGYGFRILVDDLDANYKTVEKEVPQPDKPGDTQI